MTMALLHSDEPYVDYYEGQGCTGVDHTLALDTTCTAVSSSSSSVYSITSYMSVLTTPRAGGSPA